MPATPHRHIRNGMTAMQCLRCGEPATKNIVCVLVIGVTQSWWAIWLFRSNFCEWLQNGKAHILRKNSAYQFWHQFAISVSLLDECLHSGTKLELGTRSGHFHAITYYHTMSTPCAPSWKLAFPIDWMPQQPKLACQYEYGQCNFKLTKVVGTCWPHTEQWMQNEDRIKTVAKHYHKREQRNASSRAPYIFKKLQHRDICLYVIDLVL